MPTTSATDTFLGTPFDRVRALLRAWRFGESRSPWVLADRVGLTPSRILVLLDQLDQSGLIGETDEPDVPQPNLTPAGRSLALSRHPVRKDRAQARARLEAIIARIAGLGGRADLPFTVDQVWLSGDMLDPNAGRIGTIDLAIRYREDGVRAALLDRYYSLAQALAMTVPPGRNPADTLPPLVRAWMIYDGVRPNQVQERPLQALVAKAIPCRCLYDSARGGIVDDPVLARHPDAPAARAHPDAVDLAALEAHCTEPYRPFDARLLNPPETVVGRYERFGPWPRDDDAYRQIRHQALHDALFLAQDDRKGDLSANALARRLRLRRSDGHRRVALVLGQRDLRKGYPDRAIPPLRGEIAVVIERRVIRRRDRTEYRLRVVTLDRLRTHRAADEAHAVLLTWWLHVLACTDLEGLALRDADGPPLRVIVRVNDADAIGERLSRLIAQTPGFAARPATTPEVSDVDMRKDQEPVMHA